MTRNKYLTSTNKHEIVLQIETKLTYPDQVWHEVNYYKAKNLHPRYELHIWGIERVIV